MLINIYKLINEDEEPFFVFCECAEEQKPFFILNKSEFEQLLYTVNQVGEGFVNTYGDVMDKIRKEYKNFGKVAAIKMYREIFGSDLRTAKNVIDSKENEWRR